MKNDLTFINQELLIESIQLNPFSEIDIKYHEICDGCGYWIVKNLFKNFPLFVEVAKLSPIFNPTDEYGYNCFFKQNLPSFQLRNLKYFLKDFIKNNLNYECENLIFNDYGNLFKYGKITTQKTSLLPHSDISLTSNLKTIVASNIWLSEGFNGSTAFWKYKESLYSNEDYQNYASSFLNRYEMYDNYEGDSYLQKIGECPSEYGTMTLYDANLLHSPVINKDKNHLRWSYVLVGMEVTTTKTDHHTMHLPLL